MKTKGILGIAGLIVVMAASAANAQAQDSIRHGRMDGAKRDQQFHHGDKGRTGGNHRMHGLPNVTAEQQKKIDALKTPYEKELLPLRNQLAEKKAHLRTLQTAEKVDLNAVNKTIDEMGALRSQMAKKSAAHREEFRKLLTDEQRVAFDSRATGKHRGNRDHQRGGGKRM